MVVSVLLEALAQLSPGIDGLQVSGANIQVARIFQNLLRSEEIEALEVFLPPTEYLKQDFMARIAEALLEPHHRGKGRLRFYSIFDLPGVWSDRARRILLCLSLELLPRDRYVRDRFAVGPTPISCQLHALGYGTLYEAMGQVAQMPSAPFDAVTCLSQSAMESLRVSLEAMAPGQPWKLKVVPNAVDADCFHPLSQAEKEAARKRLDLPEDATIVLFVGRVSPYSKAELVPLIRAFANVSKESDVLVIVGPENVEGYVNKLREEGQRLGLGDRLIVRGPVNHSETAQLYGAADVFAFPCDNVLDTFGSTVTEAMASGLPVLVSAWDGMKDQVEDGVQGFLVPTTLLPGLEAAEAMSPALPQMVAFLLAAQAVYVDYDGLCVGLERLLGDADLRQKMGEKGRETVLARNSWQAVNDGLLSLWRECLEEASSESEGSRQARRDHAAGSSQVIRFADYYAPYAGGPAEIWVSVSEFGRKVLAGSERLVFYDEVVAMLKPPLVNYLMNFGAGGVKQVQSFAKLAELASAKTGFPVEDANFHIAALLKAGVLKSVNAPSD
jgi:glycosyltransferase involved in cell wall biosynthesis